tara:strand:- start:1950 stop:2708 length:759 start_codon:yes stop_codon:yes gene_type:complete
MSKNIELDKFYTPKETAKKCIDIFNNTFKNVTEIIEPSAGNGNFSLQIPNCIAYDLEPEHESIIKQDFLKLDLPYRQGRAFIGNPPFGDRNNLSRSFYKHACKMADMIGFILPISQLDNTDSLYLFDLVKSIDLGEMEYSGMKVHCCFNLYKRPSSGEYNKKKNYDNGLIEIYRDDLKDYDKITDYDFCLTRRGDLGKIRTKNINSSSFKIKVNNKERVEEVIDVITNFDWHGYKKHQSAPCMSKNDIWKLF